MKADVEGTAAEDQRGDVKWMGGAGDRHGVMICGSYSVERQHVYVANKWATSRL